METEIDFDSLPRYYRQVHEFMQPFYHRLMGFQPVKQVEDPHAVTNSHVIALTGSSGCGKTTIIKALADHFHIDRKEIISAGNLMRKLAEEAGVDLNQFTEVADHDPLGRIDRYVDKITIDSFARPGIPVVIAEGRLPVYWAHIHCPERSTRVLVHVGESRFGRLFNRDWEKFNYRTVEDCKEATLLREDGYRKRFLRLYGPEAADFLNPAYQSFQISNEGQSITQTVDFLIKKLDKALTGTGF